MSDSPPLDAVLPAAVLRLSGAPPSTEIDAEVPRLLARGVEAAQLDRGLWAVLPGAANPAVVETALALARLLGLGGDGQHGPAQLSGLVFPAVVRLDGGSWRMLHDDLLDALARRPPALEPGRVRLVRRCLRDLERPLVMRPVEEGEEGRAATALYEPGEGTAGAPPWRNPKVVGRTVHFATRPTLSEALLEQRQAPLLLVHGPLGVGKTRTLWELTQAERNRLWVRLDPRPLREGPLESQILGALRALHASRPPILSPRDLLKELAPRGHTDDFFRWIEGVPTREAEPTAEILAHALGAWARLDRQAVRLVVDELEAATTRDLEILQHLGDAAAGGSAVRLILCGRSPIPSGRAWKDVPALEVPPLTEREGAKALRALLEGISLPDSVEESLLAAAAGRPFLLEEGLRELVRRKHLRQVEGGLVFSGPRQLQLDASWRLVRHLEAEALRLVASGDWLRILAATEYPLPATAVAAVAARLERPLPDRWEERLRGAGMLAAAPGAQHAQLVLPTPLHAAAARATLPDEAHARIEDLLATLPPAERPAVPRHRALRVLQAEARRHREEGGDEATELELLWHLLALARRQGALQGCRHELERAAQLAGQQTDRVVAASAWLAEVEEADGRFKEAEQVLKRALSALGPGGSVRRKALLTLRLARVQIRAGDLERPASLLERLLPALEEAGHRALAATCRFHLAEVALRRGRVEEANRHHLAAFEERRRQKLRRLIGLSLAALGRVDLAAGELARALQHSREAVEILERHGREADLAIALLGLGRTLGRLGDPAAATRSLQRALAVQDKGRDGAGQAVARLALAENQLALGQQDEALRQARLAHFQLGLLSDEPERAEAEQLLGRIHLLEGQPEEALRYLREALELHKRRGDDRGTVTTWAWMAAAALELEDGELVRHFARQLEATLAGDPALPERELAEMQLFRALDWLLSEGETVADPVPHLRRAHEELLRKAKTLDGEARRRFLDDVPLNRQIVAEARRRRLGRPGATS